MIGGCNERLQHPGRLKLLTYLALRAAPTKVMTTVSGMLGKGNGGNGKGIDYSYNKGSSSGDGWKGNKGDGSNKGWGKGPGYNDWPDVTFFNNDKGSKGKGASISMTPALPLPPQGKGRRQQQ